MILLNEHFLQPVVGLRERIYELLLVEYLTAHLDHDFLHLRLELAGALTDILKLLVALPISLLL